MPLLESCDICQAAYSVGNRHECGNAIFPRTAAVVAEQRRRNEREGRLVDGFLVSAGFGVMAGIAVLMAVAI